MKKIQYKIEYTIFQSLLFIIRITPKPIISFYGNVFGLLLYYFGVRRKVVGINLEIAFGKELNKRQLKQLAKENYKNISRIMFEFLLMRFIPPDDLGKYIEIEGLNILKDALKEGKGAVVAGNHFGHWELMAAGISKFLEPLHIYSGQQKNTLFDNAINDIRRKFGTVTISKSKKSAFKMMKALRNNHPLGMAGDLNVPHDNLFVDFFGKKAVVGQGLATFTLKRKAPLIFIWVVRTGPLKHRGYIKRIYYQTTPDTQTDIQNIAQLISSELEKRIRENPDQYYWINRRWKTRPPEEKDVSIY